MYSYTCGRPRCSHKMRPWRTRPAWVQVTETVFPHLSLLPMNKALSADEWDPYLPFGITHVISNQKQMSRQAVLSTNCVYECEHECVVDCVELRWILLWTCGIWLRLKTKFMEISEHADVNHALWSVSCFTTTVSKLFTNLCVASACHHHFYSKWHGLKHKYRFTFGTFKYFTVCVVSQWGSDKNRGWEI